MQSNKNSIAEQIKNYLLSSGYKPGNRIPKQVELASALNISTRLLRDGINILVSQGFLIPKGRGGSFLANPERESVVEPIRWFYEVKDVPIYDLIQARVILETAIITEVCNNRTTKDLLLLQQIVDSEDKELSGEDDLKLDKEFHLSLISCAHNKTLDIVGNVILLQLDLVYERGLYPQNDRLRFSDHQMLIDAIYERNSEKAVRLIRKHIERCCDLANLEKKNPLEDYIVKKTSDS